MARTSRAVPDREARLALPGAGAYYAVVLAIGPRSRRAVAAAVTLIATVATGNARADEATATPLLVIVESSDVALGGAAVRSALGARLDRPVASCLDATASRTGLTLTVVVDPRRQRAMVRLSVGASRAAQRTIGLPRPPAAAIASIVDAYAALLAELGPEPAPFGRIVRDVIDPFAELPPPSSPRDEVLDPWPTLSTPISTAALATWPAGPATAPAQPATVGDAARAPTPQRRSAEPASRLSAPEPGFADGGEP